METTLRPWRTPRHLVWTSFLVPCLAVPLSAQRRAPIVPLPTPRSESAARPSVPYSYHVVTSNAPEPESDTTFELTADPSGGTAPGDVSGTQPIPDFLKGNPYRLSYVAGDYTPPPNEGVDPLLMRRWRLKKPGETTTYGFVMFKGRITAAKQKRVEALGVRLGTFHTFQSFTAVIPFKAIPALLASDDVYWVGYARTRQKIDPELAAAISTSPPDTKRFLFVNVYASDLGPNSAVVPLHEEPLHTSGRAIEARPTVMIPNGPFQRQLEADGARVISYHDDLGVFLVEAPLSSVDKFVAHDFVHFCELNQPLTVDHDRSMRLIGVDAVRGSSSTNGTKGLLGILDTGYYNAHQDLTSWAVGWSFNSPGSVWADSDGHGTHVSGTMHGRGVANPKYRGCAPNVANSGTTRFYVGKIISSATYPNNVLVAFSTFKNSFTYKGKTTLKPHAINCSWGYGFRSTNGYPGTDNISRGVDDAVYYNNQTYVFSASNTGGTSFSNEYFRSVRRPNVAKNAFSVGSCEDYQGSDSGGSWTTGRIRYSSGKGPTSDGRLKPNINAPGHWVTSCKRGTSNGYITYSGTSMAAPHVTGTMGGVTGQYASMRYAPAFLKAWVASQAMPRTGRGSWSSTAENYYYRQGLGQLDAYKAHYHSPSSNGWESGWAASTMTSATAGSGFDVLVPSDVDRVRWVLCFDEKAASPSATRACLADLDLYIDVWPFSAGYNTGEYHSARAWDTWDWYHHIASAPALRGKKVRIKIYPRVRPASGTTVKWAVGFIMQRGNPTPSGKLSMLSPSLVKPNTNFKVSVVTSVPSMSNTSCYVSLPSTGGLSVQSLSFTNQENVLWSYPGAVTDWTLGNTRYNQNGNTRTLDWIMRRSTSGLSTVFARLYADNRWPTTTTVARTICVDGLAPNNISGLTSTSHTPGIWSNQSTLKMKWNAATDNGCAGIQGLAYRLSTGGTSTPTIRNVSGNPTTMNLGLGSSSSSRYFNLRAVDRNGYFSPSNRWAGPYYVDLTKPAVTSVLINSAATYTSSLTVSVRATATDTYSGVARMRYSGNSSTWSSWMSYTSSPRTLNMAGLGWSGVEGTKSVYVQVRDRAGNLSSIRTDTIYYLRAPFIASSTAQINNVTGGYLTLTGTNFHRVNRVTFGSKILTSTSAGDWYQGYFRVLSSTQMRVYPPQALNPGNYVLRVHNVAWSSNSRVVKVVFTPGRELHCPPEILKGKTLYIVAARGNMPVTTQDMLTFSTSNKPLILSGLVSLGHGGNAVTIIDPSFFLLAMLNPHAPGNRAAIWPLPAALKAMLYFQSLKFDLTNPFVTPIRTSTMDSCKIK